MVKLTYQVDLPMDIFPYAENLLKLSERFANALLTLNWNEEAIRVIHSSRVRAYKFFRDQNFAKGYCHIPSRLRRCILEVVGEILRSQYKRMELFHMMVGALKDDEDALCIVDGEDAVLAENIRRQMLKFADVNGGYPESYVEMGTPSLDQPFLTYAPDDGQAISISYEDGELAISVKLPTGERPTRSQWRWFRFRTGICEKLRRLLDEGARLQKPRLRIIRVKSGLTKAVLDITVEVQNGEPKDSRRMLPVDTGVRKVATAVLMNLSGEQLSKPLFVRNRLLGKLLSLKDKADTLQRKLHRLPEGSKRYGHVYAEYKRCWNKINHTLYQVRHHTSLTLVKIARKFKAEVIVFEDVGNYKPPKGKKRLGDLLNTTFFRALYKLVWYKAKRLGITVEKVDPYRTSRICPRCGEKGYRIKSPRSKKPYKRGTFFYCPSCGYMADRDYVGAINIGRAFINGGYMPKEGRGSRYKPLPSLTASRSVVSTLPSLLTAPTATTPLSYYRGLEV